MYFLFPGCCPSLLQMITDFPHIPAHLIDFSSRFCYNGMELFDNDARQEIEK